MSPREPISRAPWPPLVLALLLVGLYAWQASRPDSVEVQVAFGFTPASLPEGWRGLISALFVHGSWTHVLFNSAFALAFGAAVSRQLGVDVLGALVLLAFFVLCGGLGNAGFALVHPYGESPVVGASGAVAGLMAAASRLLERRPGLAPFTSPTVVGMAAAWIAVNVLVGVFGLSPGLGSAGLPIAWEAHLAGYAAGLFLIGPFDAVIRRLHAT